MAGETAHYVMVDRKQRKTAGARETNPSRSNPQWSTSSHWTVPTNSTFSYAFINGLTFSCDPTTSPKLWHMEPLGYILNQTITASTINANHRTWQEGTVLQRILGKKSRNIGSTSMTLTYRYWFAFKVLLVWLFPPWRFFPSDILRMKRLFLLLQSRNALIWKKES